MIRILEVTIEAETWELVDEAAGDLINHAVNVANSYEATVNVTEKGDEG